MRLINLVLTSGQIICVNPVHVIAVSTNEDGDTLLFTVYGELLVREALDVVCAMIEEDWRRSDGRI